MIRLQDFDTNKYYYRLLYWRQSGYFQSYKTYKEYVLYDYVASGTYTVNEVEFNEMLKDSNITILGLKEAKYPNCYGDVKYPVSERIILTYSEDSITLCDIEITNSNIGNGINQLMYQDGIYSCVLKEGNVEIELSLYKEEVERRCDDLTVHIEYIDGDKFKKHSMVLPSGVTFKTNNFCMIHEVEANVLAVPDGIQAVLIYGYCNINEIILPESCKSLADVSNNNTATIIHGESLQVIRTCGSKIKELYISDKLHRIYNQTSFDTTIGKIHGDLRLYGACNMLDEKIIVDTDELDLTNCIIEKCDVQTRKYKSIKFPSTLSQVKLYSSTQNIEIEFNGKLRVAEFVEFYNNNYNNKNIHFKLNKGADVEVLGYLESKGVTYDYISEYK